MSVSLTAERDRIQQQVEQLEESLAATHSELELLSSETDEESDDDDAEAEQGQNAAGLVAQRERIQREIKDLEAVLGSQSPVCLSDGDSSSGEESDLGLSHTAESTLQVNLVYQQVVQEALEQLNTLLHQNQQQQKELVSQMSGPIREHTREQLHPSSYQQPIKMYLGRFLKPYFKDKLTGLGPPANQETKERNSKMSACLDVTKLKPKRWESWQKTLLIHSVTRDSLKRLTQPKLSKVDYLSQKLSTAEQTDRPQLREQIDSLERDIDLLKGKTEEDLIGDRYEDHDWEKISNIDFEGTREASDLRCFWQNFLHPSINKSRWSKEEVQQLEEISRRHEERDWEVIAEELGTSRTAFMCLQTFRRFVSQTLRRSSWSPEEDAALRELVEKMRIGNYIPYTQMSYFMEGRGPEQLMYRWTQVLDPALRKGAWSKEEDELLLAAVSRHGERNWWKIRMEVPGRSDGACRDRYHDCLKAGLKRGAFDQQERNLLLMLVRKHGVGRWAKIAAEIPNRFDAQCMREWRKMTRWRPLKTRAGGGARERRRRTSTQRSRRRLEESSEEEDEEEQVVYMDTDEEEDKEKVLVEVERREENKEEQEREQEEEKKEEEEEEEEEYIIPPIEEWVPVEKVSFLRSQLVALPSSGHAHDGNAVRSTVLDQFGCRVVIGPTPRVLREERRCDTDAMLMATPGQLRAEMLRGIRGKQPPGRKFQSGFYRSLVQQYKLMATVTPWIGNLLIPAQRRTQRTTADALRQRAEDIRLTSTPVFLLLLQTLNVDVMGCKEIIEKKKKHGLSWRPPVPPPSGLSASKVKNQKLASGLLQQHRMKEEKTRQLEQQHKDILQQLQQLQQQRRQTTQQQQQQHTAQHQLLLQQVQPQQQQLVLLQPQTQGTSQPHLQLHLQIRQQNTAPHFLQMPPNMNPQMPPNMNPQMPPNMNPQMSPNMNPQMPPLSFPRQTFLLPRPVLHPQQPLTFIHPVAGPVCLDHAPRPIGSAPSHLAPAPKESAPTPKEHSPAPHQHPPTGRKRKQKDSQENVSVSQNGLNAPCVGGGSVDVGGAGVGVGGARARADQGGKRMRKPSQKARALQEDIEAQAEAKRKKTTASPQRKRARTQEGASTQGFTAPSLLPPPSLPPPPGPQLLPGQTIWVMTPNGLVQLAGVPPLAVPPSIRHPAPPAAAFIPQIAPPTAASPAAQAACPSSSLPVVMQCLPPPFPAPTRPRPALLAPELVLRPPPPRLQPPPRFSSGSSPLGVHRASPRPCLSIIMPYKGTIRPDPAAPPPLRREALQFDPSLMFNEPREAVRDWLSGRRGAVVPGLGVALPYLPPFVSSLNTLSALLRAKKSLTKTALQILPQSAEHKRTPLDHSAKRTPPCQSAKRTLLSHSAEPKPDSSLFLDHDYIQSPCLSDMSASCPESKPAEDTQSAPGLSAEPEEEEQEEEQEERVAAVRQLVAERFAANPAYQLLKARFLSCFTVPALLATVQPTMNTSAPHSASEEEEEEGEEEEEVQEEENLQRRRRKLKKAEKSLLQCEEPGAPASSDRTRPAE